MLKVIARMKVKEENAETFKALFKELVDETVKEEGCVSYTLNLSRSDPELFILLEVWKDKAALDSHMAAEPFKRLLPQISKQLAEKMQADFCTELF